MHVYSDDIRNPNSLSQTDKKETDFGHLAQSVKTLQSGKTMVKTLKSVSVKHHSQAVSKKKLILELKRLKLDTRGSRKVLVKRLNMCQSLTKQNAHGDYPKENIFDFYVVIDFEATCDGHKIIKPENQEIIEFPAVLLNCKNGKVEDEFQSYCRPVLHPLLTDYCTKLTGITQDIVDQAPSFPETFASFNEWLQKKNLGSKFSFAIVTDGSKDMGHFLKRQCVLSNILFPEYGKYWVNIRKIFSNFYKVGDMVHRAHLINETVLTAMMKEMEYEFKGRAHSGLDDARNIACIVQVLLKDGASIIFNEKLPEETAEEQNGKRTFSLPVLQPEFEIIKAALKSNFPTINCPTNILLKSSVNEAAKKSCTNSAMLHGEILGEKTLETATKKAPAVKSGKTVPKPAQIPKNEVDNTRIDGALSNISSGDASSINLTTKIVTKDVLAKKNKKSPTIELKPNVSEGGSAAGNAKKSRNKKKSVKTTNKGTPTKDPTTTTAVKTPEKIIPVKTSLEEAPVKIPANEIPIITIEKKPSAQNPAKSAPAKYCTKKIPTTTTVKSSPTPSALCTIQSSRTKTQEKESPLITTPENRGKKTMVGRCVKKLRTEALVKEAGTNIVPNISESSNLEKTAEEIAKELKLAKKKFYVKAQHTQIPKGEFKKTLKNIENLKKSLNATRLREVPCVPCKPPVEEGVTIAKGSNVVQNRKKIQASKQAVAHSQKKKASPSKEGNNSGSKDSQGTVVRDTKIPLPNRIAASFFLLDENPRPKEESVCDETNEELFFKIFENVLDKQTMRDQEDKE